MLKNITKKLLALAVIIFATTTLSACISEEPPALKSPCVGAEGSPCGVKRPLNVELLKNHPELQKAQA